MDRSFKRERYDEQLSVKRLNAMQETLEQLQRIGGIAGLRTGTNPVSGGGGVSGSSSVYQPFYAMIYGSREPLGKTTFLEKVNASATTFKIANQIDFPRQPPFFCRAGGEIFLVIDSTLTDESAADGPQTWTVERGQSGTTAVKHKTGDSIETIVRPYLFREVYQALGAPGEWFNHPEGRHSEVDDLDGIIPAYEVKNNFLVPTDGTAIVQLWGSYDGVQSYYLFEYFPAPQMPFYARITSDFGPLATTVLLEDIDESQLFITLFNTGDFPEASEGKPFDILIDQETCKVIETPTGRNEKKEPQAWKVLRAQYGSYHTWHRKAAPIETVGLRYGFQELTQDKLGHWQDAAGRSTTVERDSRGRIKKVILPAVESKAWQRVPTDGSAIVYMRPGYDRVLQPKDKDGKQLAIKSGDNGGIPQYYVFDYWPQPEQPFHARIIAEGPPVGVARLLDNMPAQKAGDVYVIHVAGTDCFQLTVPFIILIDKEYMLVTWTDPPGEMDRKIDTTWAVVRGCLLIPKTVVPGHAMDLPIFSSLRPYAFIEVAQDVAGNWIHVKGGRQSRIGSEVLNDWGLPGARTGNVPKLSTRWQEFTGWAGTPAVKQVPNAYKHGKDGWKADHGHGDHADNAPAGSPPDFTGARYRDWNSSVTPFGVSGDPPLGEPPGGKPLDRVGVLDLDNLDRRRPPAYEIKHYPVPIGAVVQMWPGYHSTPIKKRDGPYPNAPDYYLFSWWTIDYWENPLGSNVAKDQPMGPNDDLDIDGKRNYKGPVTYTPRRYFLYPAHWSNFLLPWGSKWEFRPIGGGVSLGGFRLWQRPKGKQAIPVDLHKDADLSTPPPVSERRYYDNKGFRLLSINGKRAGLTATEAFQQGKLQEYDAATDPDRPENQETGAVVDLGNGEFATVKGNGSLTEDGADPADNVPDPYLDPTKMDDWTPRDGQRLIIHNTGPGFLTLKNEDGNTESRYRMHFVSGEDWILKPCESIVLEYSAKGPCGTGTEPKTDPYGRETPKDAADNGRWTPDTGQQAYPKDCHLAYTCKDTGIPQTSLAGSGLITQSGSTVTGSATKFLSEVVVGDRLDAHSIGGKVTAIASDTSLTLDRTNTQPSNVPYTVVPHTDFVEGSGTITQSGNTVTGVSTQFLTEVVPGYQLVSKPNASGTYVSGIVRRIATNTSLTLDTSVTVSGASTYRVIPYQARPGSGTATVEGTLLRGWNSRLLSEVSPGDLILVGGQVLTVLSVESDTALTLTRPAAPVIAEAALYWVVAQSNIRGYRCERTEDRGLPLGYPSLTRAGLVPQALLGRATPSSTTFLRGDGRWAEPTGFADMLAAQVYVDVAVSGNTTLTYLANGAAWNVVTGTTATLTLYDPTVAGNTATFIGFRIGKGFTGVLTITTPTGSIVAKGSTYTSRYYSAGDVVVMYANGTDWVVIVEESAKVLRRLIARQVLLRG